MKQTKGMKAFIEIQEQGYTRDLVSIHSYARCRPELTNTLRFFRGNTGATKGSRKYGALDLWGSPNFTIAFADTEESRQLTEQFLVKHFLALHPSPSIDLRKAFTRALHQYNLHSCYCKAAEKKHRHSQPMRNLE